MISLYFLKVLVYSLYSESVYDSNIYFRKVFFQVDVWNGSNDTDEFLCLAAHHRWNMETEKETSKLHLFEKN